MNKLYLLLWLLSAFVNGFSQEIKATKGSGQVEFLITKSRLEVQNQAKELAIVDALERAFGRVIVQGNSTYLSNLNTGKMTETKSVFNMIANTSVKGELLEVLDEKYTDSDGLKIVGGKKEKITEVRCDITIRAREIVTPPIEFIAKTLTCPDIKCEKTEFKDNDDFYLYFKSPASGYISVFLDDGKNAFRLLPFQNMPESYEGGIAIHMDEEYILFSDEKQFDYFKDDEVIIDTYQLFAETEMDMNRLFVIFSKTPLNKPRLKNALDTDALSDEEIMSGYTLPKAMESENFQRWLLKNRSYRKDDMQVGIVDITISKE